MTASASATSRFWDRIAERYARRPIPDESVYRRKLDITQRYLRPDMTLLELGCGTGTTALVHAPHVRHVHAIDVSANMLDIARAKARDQRVDNVVFEHASVEALDVPPGSVGAVLALSLLHLLPDRDAAIARIYDMLAPGGVFVTSTPCLGGARYLPLRIGLPIARVFGLVPRVAFFRVAQLRESLATAGFAIDHEWQPTPDRTVFLVALKPA